MMSKAASVGPQTARSRGRAASPNQMATMATESPRMGASSKASAGVAEIAGEHGNREQQPDEKIIARQRRDRHHACERNRQIVGPDPRIGKRPTAAHPEKASAKRQAERDEHKIGAAEAEVDDVDVRLVGRALLGQLFDIARQPMNLGEQRLVAIAPVALAALRQIGSVGGEHVARPGRDFLRRLSWSANGDGNGESECQHRDRHRRCGAIIAPDEEIDEQGRGKRLDRRGERNEAAAENLALGLR